MNPWDKTWNPLAADIFDEKILLAPLSWRKPRMVFVCSMTDLFAKFVPDEWIDRIFAVMALCPHHTFQVLTKRPAKMRAWVTQPRALVKFVFELYVEYPRWPRSGRSMLKKIVASPRGWPLPNVWLGVSCEDQDTADARIPDLLATPAAVRFVSLEPLLAPIDLTTIPYQSSHDVRLDALRGYVDAGDEPPTIRKLDWVIVGGESGPGARPMHPDWARSLRDQCAATGVPFFFKQWGEWGCHEITPGGDLGGDVRRGVVRIVHPTGQTDVAVFTSTGGRNTIPGSRYMARVGKKRAGRLLDGVEHNGMPKA